MNRCESIIINKKMLPFQNVQIFAKVTSSEAGVIPGIIETMKKNVGLLQHKKEKYVWCPYIERYHSVNYGMVVF